MKLSNVDRPIAALFSLMCGLVIAASSEMQGDAGVIPTIAGVLGIITSVTLLSQTFLSVEEATELVPVNWLRFGLWGVLILLLIASLDLIGSFIAIPVFLFASFFILARLKMISALVISLCFTGAIYLTFVWLLEVPLPNGLLSPWLDN